MLLPNADKDYNYALIAWAKKFCNKTTKEIAKETTFSEEYVTKLENGEVYATYKELVKLSKVFSIPVIAFFHDSPPLDFQNTKFRTLPSQYFEDSPKKILELIRKASAKQYALYELNDNNAQLGIDLRELKENSLLKTANKVRDWLGVSIEQQCLWKNEEDAVRKWRICLENKGIYIFKDAFKDNEYCGFALEDKHYPIIYINNSNNKNRQIFTMFHELYHLILGMSGIDFRKDNLDNLEENSKKIEIECNEFAGCFLVPESDILERIGKYKITEFMVDELAEYYKVSREVIALRLFQLEKITYDFLQNMLETFTSQYKGKKENNGGNYFNNLKSYLGAKYVNLVFDSYRKGKISQERIADYLGVSLKNISHFDPLNFGGGH